MQTKETPRFDKVYQTWLTYIHGEARALALKINYNVQEEELCNIWL